MVAGLALAAPMILAASRAAAANRRLRNRRFVVCYDRAFTEAVNAYDIAVLDSDVAGLPPPRRDRLRLGYISLGEVHGGRSYAAALAGDGVLLDPSPVWPDARMVDMRSPRWRDRLLDEILPPVLAAGFQGFFFDTLDTAEALERQDAARFAGMIDGAAELARAVRRRFPKRPVMINRGYAVLPRIAGEFDMLLGESVRSTFDARAGTYSLVTDADYRWQLDRMDEAYRRDRRLRLFSLDYWDMEDLPGIARLYAEARERGFVPYVGTFDLTRIVPEA
ncbi:hypothetical protein EAH89_09725 [Roseomonas nepalensis]|uniref:Glycoside-hydrolase family GH114 TIM-barrel domain-containing protein n=1 Tax=Muricoccus nepalensis TaxID=1854500 RepID=A0A502G7W1_9PROT|nr:endo alpha-1,4 polygalactosaminidase [Roseomonas nepalensis]TPG57702.1 hypothetical protein EAH89_09725 [Roseomonas nepalensis]